MVGLEVGFSTVLLITAQLYSVAPRAARRKSIP